MAIAGAIEKLAIACSEPKMMIEAVQRQEAIKRIATEYKDWEIIDKVKAFQVMKSFIAVQIFLSLEAGDARDLYLRTEIDSLDN